VITRILRDFGQDEGDLNARVSGQLIFNTSEHIVDAALAGLGMAFLPEEEFASARWMP